MTIQSSTNTDLFLRVNHFAERTSWLQGPMKVFSNYGIVLFVVLLALGWLYSRKQDIQRLAALVWAGIGTLVAVGINQFVSGYFQVARPYTSLQHILVLGHRGTDYSFPSDHATMAGAVTAGLFLVNPLLGFASLILALIMAFSRIYIGVHYPADVAAGLALGAAVVLICYLIVRKPLAFITSKLAGTPLRPLITDKPAATQE